MGPLKAASYRLSMHYHKHAYSHLQKFSCPGQVDLIVGQVLVAFLLTFSMGKGLDIPPGD